MRPGASWGVLVRVQGTRVSGYVQEGGLKFTTARVGAVFMFRKWGVKFMTAGALSSSSRAGAVFTFRVTGVLGLGASASVGRFVHEHSKTLLKAFTKK